MRDLPGPGLEPVSPALAGGFLTTAPPGKPLDSFLKVTLTAMRRKVWWLRSQLRGKVSLNLKIKIPRPPTLGRRRGSWMEVEKDKERPVGHPAGALLSWRCKRPSDGREKGQGCQTPLRPRRIREPRRCCHGERLAVRPAGFSPYSEGSSGQARGLSITVVHRTAGQR